MRARAIGWTVGLSAALGAACATTSEVRPQAETHVVVEQQREQLVPAPPVREQVDPKQLAARSVSAKECSEEAKSLRGQGGGDLAWAALKACVERGSFPRGAFTDLRLLLGNGWDDDLAHRPDAPQLMARLIALRGGDVDGDLQLLQQARVPLFSLGAALKQPDFYRGRYVLVHANLDEAKAEAGRPTAHLSELAVNAVMTERRVEGRNYNSTSSYQGSWNASASSTYYGKAKAQGGYQSNSRSTGYTTEAKYENRMAPTGRNALGRLGEFDPFLEPGKDYVFLARFDGVRTTPHGEDEPADQVAVLTVVAYFRPAALLVD